MSLLLFFNGGSDPGPTVALNSPANGATTNDTTPTLEFTGTDPQGQDVRYQVQVDTSSTFTGTTDYYFNASIAGPTDGSVGGLWTNHANAFDGNTSTFANSTDISGDSTSENLRGTGTNAPTSGGEISGVRARIYGSTNSGTAAYSSYVTLTVPSGGWTWQKVKDLEVRFWSITSMFPGLRGTIFHSVTSLGEPTITGGTTSWQAYRAEIEVTHTVLLDKTSGTDPGFAGTTTLATVDSYVEANRNENAGFNNTSVGYGQSFTGAGGTLKNAKFHLSKQNAPTGNAVAKIYAHSGTFGTSSLPTGTALATSDNFDVSTLTTTPTISTFNFSGSNRISLVNDTKYVVTMEYTGPDANFNVLIGRDSTSPTHSGNSVYSTSGTWGSDSSRDYVFYVQTEDYTSGVLASYTVQSALSEATYYWRVRALDPSGGNDWGLWSGSRNFSISSGTVLTVADLNSGSTTDAIALTQANTLAVNDLTGASTIDAVSLTQQNTLVINELASASTLDSVTVTTNTPLTMQELTSATALDTFALTQAHNLVVNDLTANATLDGIALVQQNTLAMAELSSASALDSVNLIQGYVMSLADLTAATTLDSIALTQANTLVMQEPTSASTLDSVALTQANTLAMQELQAASTLDAVSLVQAHQLAVGGLASSSTLDGIGLSQANTLAMQDIVSLSTLDGFALTQAHNLQLADLLAGTTLDSVALTQAHNLAIADLAAVSTLDSVVLISGNSLTMNNLRSVSTLDNIALTQASTLATGDLASASTLDGLTITYNALLSVHKLASPSTLGGITLIMTISLVPAHMASTTTLDAATLTQQNLLSVADLASLTNLDAVTLATIAFMYRLRVWTGEEWRRIPTKVYDGTAWKEKQLKYYDGSVWR